MRKGSFITQAPYSSRPLSQIPYSPSIFLDSVSISQRADSGILVCGQYLQWVLTDYPIGWTTKSWSHFSTYCKMGKGMVASKLGKKETKVRKRQRKKKNNGEVGGVGWWAGDRRWTGRGGAEGRLIHFPDTTATCKSLGAEWAKDQGKVLEVGISHILSLLSCQFALVGLFLSSVQLSTWSYTRRNASLLLIRHSSGGLC